MPIFCTPWHQYASILLAWSSYMQPAVPEAISRCHCCDWSPKVVQTTKGPRCRVSSLSCDPHQCSVFHGSCESIWSGLVLDTFWAFSVSCYDATNCTSRNTHGITDIGWSHSSIVHSYHLPSLGNCRAAPRGCHTLVKIYQTCVLTDIGPFQCPLCRHGWLDWHKKYDMYSWICVVYIM